MRISLFPSSIETVRALMSYLVGLVNAEPEKKINIAVSGGNASALLFDFWANENSHIPWNRIKIFWVNECCVSPKNSESNYGLMYSLLLKSAPIPYENIFRIQGENESEQEAVRYLELIREQVPIKHDFPVFDIVLLEVENDGHTASLFGGQEELLVSESICAVSVHPNNGQKYITLTGMSILNARKVVLLATGKDKARAVEDICYSGDISSAAYIAHHADSVELFVDNLAASNYEEAYSSAFSEQFF